MSLGVILRGKRVACAARNISDRVEPVSTDKSVPDFFGLHASREPAGGDAGRR